MTTFRAIGGVSTTLKTLLVERVDSPPGLGAPLSPIPVSVGMPPEEDGDDKPQLNLFLYRVTENGYLKNQEIPGRGYGGTAYGHPPLSLNLHYLLTAYGSTKTDGNPPLVDDFVAHYLLGSAMRVLHEVPIITEELETAAGLQILDASLRGEYETVKLTLEPLSLEDVAKVWTALNRPFRLSAAYEVSVVQIEPEASRSYPLPVAAPPPGGPRVRSIAARRPRIDEVHAATRPGPYAAVGDTLVLTGSGLLGEPTLAWLGELDATGSVVTATDERVTIVVPDDPALQPGILAVRVAHGVELGEPPTPHVGMRSNTAAFVLVPSITQATRLAGPTLRLRGTRLLAPDAECLTIVGGNTVPSSDYLAGANPTEIKLPIPPGAVPGDHVRVRVSGAESLEDVRLP